MTFDSFFSLLDSLNHKTIHPTRGILTQTTPERYPARTCTRLLTNSQTPKPNTEKQSRETASPANKLLQKRSQHELTARSAGARLSTDKTT